MDNSKNKTVGKPISRREAIRLIGATSVATLVGCTVGSPAPTATSSNAAATTAPTAAATAASTATAAAAPTATASTAGGWLSGGTNLITVDFPDTAIFDTGGTCNVSLTQETTLGPCYFEDDTGEDMSNGLSGLPMQLCLRLVDNNCQPLEGYTIEVWHCDNEGIYSGDTSESDDGSSFAGDFCTGGDEEAAVSTWYRGKLTTDSDGRVNFKTCFPGWYSGRTIHIHFAVSEDGGSTRNVISQFCFTDEFAKEICTTHELYSSRGEQDTTFAGGDNVFPSSGYEAFLMTTAQNPDGSLLAYHTIQIDPSVVSTGGSGGGPGGERPPGGGGPGGGRPPGGGDPPPPPGGGNDG